MNHTLILLALMTAAAFAAEKLPLPTAQTTRNIEGGTVRVDDRLVPREEKGPASSGEVA